MVCMSIDTSKYNLNSNVSNLNDARIICLGETHFNRNHQQNNGRIIASLYGPKDVVLVEAEENVEPNVYQSRIDHQTQYVNKPIQIRGWDIIRPYADWKTAASEAKPLIEKSVKLLLGSFIASSILKSAFGVNLYLDLIIPIVGIAGMFISHLGKVAKENMKNLPLRNRNMFKVIDSALKEKEKVFVIAGSLHFEKCDATLRRAGLNNDDCIDETMRFFKDKKYAILTPK